MSNERSFAVGAEIPDNQHATCSDCNHRDCGVDCEDI